VRERALDDRAGAGAQGVLQGADGPRGEAPLHDLADPGVLRRVHVSMISRWTSICSRWMCSLKRMTAVLRNEEKISGCVETYLTSACRVTAQ